MSSRHLSRLPATFLAAWSLAAVLTPSPSAAQAPVIRVPGDSPTLTAAIAAISDGGIVELAAGTYAAPAGGFAVLNPNKRLTIRAGAGALVVLSGNGVQPVLRYQVTVAAQRGHLILEDLIFRDGRSAADGVAGGVTLSGGAQATFQRCTFESNSSQAPTTGGGGAGVFGASKVFFIDSLFASNSAKNEGAGLAVGEGAEVYVHHSRFADNSCAAPGHRASAAGGAIHLRNAQVWITDSRFEGNRAGYAGGALYAAGAWQDPLGTPRALAMITNSTFIANVADNDPGVATPGPSAGGALHAEDQTYLEVNYGRFVKNDADQGGAISLYRSHAAIGNSVLLGNRALGAGLYGGAIRASSEDTPADGAINRRNVNLTVRRSLIAGRYQGVTTVGERGGGIYITGDVSRAWGLGGVGQQGTLAANRASLGIEDSILIDLDVTRAGGGSGGAVESHLTNIGISGSLFAGCDALGTSSAGGAMRLSSGSSINLFSSTFIGNTAVAGGALHVQGSVLTATSNQFLRNEVSPGVNEPAANSFGAAIYSAQLAPVPYGLNQNGMVASNLFSENVGLPVYDDDRNGPIINDLRYDANSFWNTTFGGQVYADLLTGPQTTAELNSLLVIRSAAGPTDKSPSSNNVALGARPDLGFLSTAPRFKLPAGAAGDDPGAVPAYIAWAWSGGSGATLDGASLAASWGWQESTTGLHTLSVGSGSALARIDNGPIVAAGLEFSPPSISPGGTSTLSWFGLPGSNYTHAAIDQQIATGGSTFGSTEVTPNVTRPYTMLLFAEEGGAMTRESILVGEVVALVFADGFESGSTAEWDQTSP